MQIKTGTLSKMKIFATIMNNDSSLYIIDQKRIKKVNGLIPDRINPYVADDNMSLAGSSVG